MSAFAVGNTPPPTAGVSSAIFLFTMSLIFIILPYFNPDNLSMFDRDSTLPISTESPGLIVDA